MTLMGCKKPRKGTAKPRTGVKTGSGKGKEYDEFMRQFHWAHCERCGATFWGDKKYMTTGHHILYQSTHPEYATIKENVIALCPVHHSLAHNKPNEFLEWLKENRPEAWAWREKHNHHRKESI